MKLKTAASIIVTFLPFLSPPPVRKHHQIARALSYSHFRDYIFYIYGKKKKNWKRAENYFIFKSLLLSFPGVMIFVYDHHWGKPELAGQNELSFKIRRGNWRSNFFHEDLNPIKAHTSCTQIMLLLCLYIRILTEKL